MKSTGVVRKVDELGRVVLPKELLGTLDIQIRDPLEIFVDEDMILLRKYQPGCVFCGSAKDVVEFKGNRICHECKEALKKS